MRSAGIDVAKTGFAAVSLAVDGELRRSKLWKPKNPKASGPVILDDQFNWLSMILAFWKPDIVSVEELQVFMSKPVIRALSQHEGIALLAAKRCKSCYIVVNPSASTVRGIVMGKGNASKDQMWEWMKKEYPDYPWKAKTAGGTDQADSAQQALAGPVVAERKR